jgi:hypothetical protein
MTEEERRRRLRRVYALLCKLADESITPDTEALEGDGAGVAEDADERHPQSHFSRDWPKVQEPGAKR